MYKYTYDPWNRLVKVTMKQDSDITIQTAKFDAPGSSFPCCLVALSFGGSLTLPSAGASRSECPDDQTLPQKPPLPRLRLGAGERKGR